MYKITNSMYYDQGPEAGSMQFLITTDGATVGSFVSISSTKQGPKPVISLPETKVTKPDFATGVDSDVPAGYTDTLTVKYSSNEPIDKGFSLTFSVQKIEKTEHSDGIGPTPVTTVKQVVTSV